MYGFVERLLARTLMAHLGEFVEGIRSEDINISIFTGGCVRSSVAEGVPWMPFPHRDTCTDTDCGILALS